MQKQATLILFCLMTLLPFFVQANNPFDKSTPPTLLAPEEAFVIKVMEIDDKSITLDIRITPGYYLYREQFTFEPSRKLVLGDIHLPQGEIKTDDFFGTQSVYEQNTMITIPVLEHPAQAELIVGYRGCAPVGVCYPFMEKILPLDFKTASVDGSSHFTASNILAHRHFLAALAIFFGFGLLLAFTPCVLPMLPILSGVILGQKHLNRLRAFELSSIYVLAVALTFAIAGIIAALLGASLQSYLQNTYVFIFSAAILMVLAVLLLIDAPLELPSALNNKLHDLSRKQKGGTVFGVAMMGVLSALVVSPCVTPPLIGALIYIAESGNVALGGSALFMLGLGMGVPLILFSVFGMHALPKQGAWLRGIKILFAVLLFALALSLVTRATPEISTTPKFDYISVQTIQEVETQIQQAAKEQKPVILDFYADWCVSCKNMENTVFTDPKVQALLKQAKFLKIDVTKNTPEDKALLKHYNIYGPPALLFFSKTGQPQPEFQIVGEITTNDLTTHLEQWLNKPTPPPLAI